MNGKLIIFGIAFVIVQLLANLHLFVTFSDMQAYAAPKETIQQLQDQLNRIEHKIDKLILGY